MNELVIALGCKISAEFHEALINIKNGQERKQLLELTCNIRNSLRGCRMQFHHKTSLHYTPRMPSFRLSICFLSYKAIECFLLLLVGLVVKSSIQSRTYGDFYYSYAVFSVIH